MVRLRTYGKELLLKGLRWMVGNGKDIRFWDDQWIINLPEAKITTIPPENQGGDRVSDFINQQSFAWKVDQLQEYLSDEEIQAIVKIPISKTGNADKLVWPRTKSGQYTAKSRYAMSYEAAVRSRLSKPSSSSALPKSMWSKLWSVPTAPKVRNFIWRVVRNWVACKDNLFRRKCANSPVCTICGENETIEHILLRCPWTKAVWFGSGLSFWTLEYPLKSADKWVEDLLCGCLAKESDPERLASIFQICCAIWKARNEYVFGDIMPNPEKTILKASLASSDYLQVAYEGRKSPNVKANRSGKWSPPTGSVIKFNCDGAFSSSRSLAAFGIVARDSGGVAQVCHYGRLQASTAAVTEAWALRIACGMAVDMDLSEAIFESDCKELIESLNREDHHCDWEISVLVEDIKKWASSRNWSFTWCCREMNRAAHWVATNCLSRKVVLCCIPPELDAILVRDKP